MFSFKGKKKHSKTPPQNKATGNQEVMKEKTDETKEVLIEQSKPPAVKAIEKLLVYLSQENSNTFQEFHQNIRAKIDSLKGESKSAEVECVTEIFLRFVSLKTANYDENLTCAKADLKSRAQVFLQHVLDARSKVASVGQSFISEGSVVLVHGDSEAVILCLVQAANAGKKFTVYVTESRTSTDEKESLGLRTCGILERMKVDHILITDSAVAYFMGKVDLVLVGAEAVAKNGGIINTIGCYSVALCAKKYNKPVYVAVEKYKFSNIYPLRQEDAVKLAGYSTENTIQPKVDYTPPEFLNLLFTDLGPLTTAAVSDVMMELYL